MILDKETYTRQELADMIGVAKKSISAWCSKSKMTLIPMSDNPDMIDMRVEKNLIFTQKKLKERESGTKTTPFTGMTSAEKKTVLNTKKLSEPQREKRKYIKQKDKEKIDVINKPTIKESKLILTSQTPAKLPPIVQSQPMESEEVKQMKKRQKEIAEEINNFERKKRELTIIKLEEDIKRKQIERERIEGDYVKTEDVISMFESATNKQGQIIKAVLDSEFQYIGIKENISSEVISRYKEKFLNKYNREIERMREEIDI